MSFVHMDVTLPNRDGSVPPDLASRTRPHGGVGQFLPVQFQELAD